MVKPEKKDIKYAVERLHSEFPTLFPKDIEDVYMAQGYHYDKAWNVLSCAQEEKNRQRVGEEEKKRRDLEEWGWKQVLIQVAYDARILPALRSWLRTNPQVDVLRIAEDWIYFFDELTQRCVVTIEPAGDKKRVMVTEKKGGGWKAGTGISDDVKEAVVQAWWDYYGEKE